MPHNLSQRPSPKSSLDLKGIKKGIKRGVKRSAQKGTTEDLFEFNKKPLKNKRLQKALREETQPQKQKQKQNNVDHSLQKLLDQQHLWRAHQLPPHTPDTVSSGYARLDEQLPGHGWPTSGLSELLLSTAGVGELKLLAPVLKHFSQQNRWVAWVNPPFIPYAPALKALGVDTNKILLIHTKNHKEALWALERVSKSGNCSMVLGWLDDKQTKVSDTRRFQLAAKQGNTLTCLFRPESAAAKSSMAQLRLKISGAHANKIKISIVKRKGGWPVENLPVPIRKADKTALIAEKLALWRRHHKHQTLNPTLDQKDHQQDQPAIGKLTESQALNSSNKNAHQSLHTVH